MPTQNYCMYVSVSISVTASHSHGTKRKNHSFIYVLTILPLDSSSSNIFPTLDSPKSQTTDNVWKRPDNVITGATASHLSLAGKVWKNRKTGKMLRKVLSKGLRRWVGDDKRNETDTKSVTRCKHWMLCVSLIISSNPATILQVFTKCACYTHGVMVETPFGSSNNVLSPQNFIDVLPFHVTCSVSSCGKWQVPRSQEALKPSWYWTLNWQMLNWRKSQKTKL